MEIELREPLVVLSLGSLALIDRDIDSGLLVLVGRECLRLLGGDDGPSRDDVCHDAPYCFDAERERGHIKDEQWMFTVREMTAEYAGLDSSAIGYGLVGIDASVRLFAVEVVLKKALDLGNARGATDEDDLIHFTFLHCSV